MMLLLIQFGCAALSLELVMWSFLGCQDGHLKQSQQAEGR